LLNRFGVKTSNEGSNPTLSAITIFSAIAAWPRSSPTTFGNRAPLLRTAFRSGPVQESLSQKSRHRTGTSRLCVGCTSSSHIKPSDLRAQAEKLIADRMMPDLGSLLDAIRTIRTEYQPRILEARRQARIHVVRKKVGT